jgi:membrane-bound lytic murein transglycosylase D
MTKKIKLSVGIGFSALLVMASGCAHQPKTQASGQALGPSSGQTSNQDPAAADEAAESDAPQVTLRDVESFRVTDPEGPKVTDEELEEIPTEINPLVNKWVDYFQGRGRPHMERYLARSSRYMKLMKKILRQNGLPEDLVYIALIESGFTYKATSRAAAVGYWQFIKGTGKRYGLEINSLIDERRDPVMSTQAAAEYFKGLYSVFGSWYLAMASYNVGENRVKREVMNHYTRDFWELAAKRRFPKETINYIPKFIAAKLIGNNPEKYGFVNIEYQNPIEFEHVKLEKPVNLRIMAEKMGIDYDDLKDLNPKFKGEIAPMKSAGLELRVPLGQIQAALAAAPTASVERVEYVADAGETQVYKIKSGDSLYTVARKYKTTVAWLRDMNDLKKGRKLRIGQRIAVPDRSSRKTVVKAVAKVEPKIEKKEDVEQASTVAEVVTNKGVFYIVQPGDTLSAIADDYNSNVEELRRMNKMTRGSMLRAGMKLRVPKDEGLPVDPSGAKRTDKSVADKEKDAEQGSVVPDVRTATSREPQSNAPAHVVQPGENLTTIAKKYGVTLGALRKANNLSKRSMLRVGARLNIPAEARPQSLRGTKMQGTSLASFSPKRISMRRAHRPRVHIVKRGENLTQIAGKYKVSIQTLKTENRIPMGSKLFVGSKLLIPVANAIQ